MYNKAPARYSPIAPIALLEGLQDKCLLGNYLLILGHDVLANISRYENLLDCLTEESEEQPFIILDNSAVELGEPLSPKEMHQIIDDLPIDCYVVPDVLGNFKETCRLASDFEEVLKELNVPIMKVPQGTNNTELIQCIQFLQDNIVHIPHEIYGDLWGIPRWITNQIGSRKSIIQFLNTFLPQAPMHPHPEDTPGDFDYHSIHLLGMSENFQDDIDCLRLPTVIGIDSANPMTLGQQGIKLSEIDHDVPHITRGSLWEGIMITPASVANIYYINKLIAAFELNESSVMCNSLLT